MLLKCFVDMRGALLAGWLALSVICPAAAEKSTVTVTRDEAQVLAQVRTLRATDIARAKEVLNRALAAMEKPTPALLFALADITAAQNEPDKAIGIFRQVLKLAPDFPGAGKNLGRLLFAQGAHEAAAEALRQGMDNDGLDGDSCALLGQCYVLTGQYFLADAPLRFALITRPDDWRCRYHLAYACYGQGLYQASEAVLKPVLKQVPRERDGWILLANVRIASGRTAEAIDALEACLFLELDLGHDLLWTLGDLYLNEGIPESAARVYRQAAGRGKPSRRSLQNAATAFLAMGDGDNARFFSERLIKDFGEDARGLFALGTLADRDQLTDKARQYFNRAARADPLWPRPIFALGDLAARNKDYARALGHYKTARSIKGAEEDALRAEAGLLLQLSRLDEALVVLKDLETRYPGKIWRDLIQEIRLRLQKN